MLLLARIWVLRIAYYLCWPLPVQRKVVLASNDVDRLRGSLAYIHDELASRDERFRVVRLLHRPSPGLAGKLRMFVYALRAEYHLATSRVFVVDDYFFPIYVIRPKRQTTIIQTWHACGAFKKVGYSVVGKGFGASRRLVDAVDIHSNYDVCLVASQTAVNHYAEAFRQPPERFVALGIPHTDFFSDQERMNRAASRLRDELGLPTDRDVVLYAPTFRGTSKRSARHDDVLDLASLQAAVGKTHVVLMRRHPLVAEHQDLAPELQGFAIDVSSHPDPDELLALADVLVTDYSSLIFEFSLLGRPMAFLAPDREAYEKERGFYFDYDSGVPGPVFSTTSELAAWLAGGDFDLERVRAFAERSFDRADGLATQRVVDQIILPALGITSDS